MLDSASMLSDKLPFYTALHQHSLLYFQFVLIQVRAEGVSCRDIVWSQRNARKQDFEARSNPEAADDSDTYMPVRGMNCMQHNVIAAEYPAPDTLSLLPLTVHNVLTALC